MPSLNQGQSPCCIPSSDVFVPYAAKSEGDGSEAPLFAQSVLSSKVDRASIAMLPTATKEALLEEAARFSGASIPSTSTRGGVCSSSSSLSFFGSCVD